MHAKESIETTKDRELRMEILVMHSLLTLSMVLSLRSAMYFLKRRSTQNPVTTQSARHRTPRRQAATLNPRHQSDLQQNICRRELQVGSEPGFQ
jgi:hypothetical protein